MKKVIVMKKLKNNPIKIIPMKPINILSKHSDLDRDGVPDRKDCMPINPWKQHIRPSKTMQKRLENIPLFVTDKPLVPGKKVESYHILEAKKRAPKAQREMYSVIKEYPSVVSEIEREKPSSVLYASSPHLTEVKMDKKTFISLGQTIPRKFSRKANIIVTPMKPSYTKKEVKEYGIENLDLDKDTSLSERELTRRAITAQSLFHELRHQHQFREVSPRKIRKKRMQYAKKILHKKDFFDKFSEKYKDVPFEKEAHEYAEKKMKEYDDDEPPTGEEISKVLKLDDEREEE